MAEQMLPFFSKESQNLSLSISVQCNDDWVVYFNGLVPLFSHNPSDLASFRMITSQLYHSGHCKQTEIAALFGVSIRSVKRSYQKYLKNGPAQFFSKEKPGTRKSGIFTPEFTSIVQAQLDEGQSKKEIAKNYNIKIDTFNKAIRDGRLTEKKKTSRM